MKRMPVLFLGHGSPMNAIEPNAFHLSWRDLGQKLPRPRAILCISAHWETRGVHVTSGPKPETVHDFAGFPKALFDVQYPAPGEPELAFQIVAELTAYGLKLDNQRGLDHGAWSVLMAMYPDAKIPVLQLSLDTARPAAFHYELGQALAPLREHGLLIVGSGNLVHNLRLFDRENPIALPWATEFDRTVQRLLNERQHPPLIDYQSLGPSAQLAIPTAEHYLPLLYAIALQGPKEPLRIFNDTVLGSIAMTSLVIGEAP